MDHRKLLVRFRNLVRRGKQAARGPLIGKSCNISLDRRQLAKMQMLAERRGQTLEATIHATIGNLLASVPSGLKDRNLVRRLDFRSIGMEGKYTKIVLGNGKTFYGYPSRQRYRDIFNACRDVIPDGFTAETYQAAADAAFRYMRGAEYRFFPGPGGVVIEGGAFVGYKSVRFAEVLGDQGKVIAIEIGRENFELLVRNVAANGVGHIVTPVHCGIWKESGRRTADFQYANSYHLATPDEHDWCTDSESVPTATLDDIIEQHQLNEVDYLNLQLNGAEYEGLMGLNRHFDKVKVIRVAAYYTRDGVRETERVQALLKSKGCKILVVGVQGHVIAATPRFAHLYAPLPSA